MDEEKRAWTAEERRQLASGRIAGGFAGPNQSYPIASAADVRDAWGLAGHAGNPDEVRRAIIRIARRHGWMSGLPDSARQWMEEHGMRMEEKAVESNALKAIAKTDTELRVGNYMILFGGSDLEGIASPRKNQDGSVGEYFTKATTFDSPYTDLDLVAVDWEHGAAPEDEPGPDDVLGRVDWKTAKIDDKGLFVERVLNRRNRYVQFLEELIDAGMIGNSSEAVSDGVQKATDGEIQRWPLRRDTLTVTPMEPRMITQNAIHAIKALSERYPALKSYLPADATNDAETDTPEAGSAPAAPVAEDEAKARALSIEIELLEI